MMLSNRENTIAIAGRKEVEKILDSSGAKIEDLRIVDGWAIKGLPDKDNSSDYWPIVNGNILHWSYDQRFVRSVMRIVDEFDRGCEILVHPDLFIPIFFKLDMVPEKYIAIAPRSEKFGGD